MSTYNLRTRRQHTPEPTEPMTGAGYDIEEEERHQEERWATLEHAVQLSLNYFKRNPLPAEHADLVRASVLARAHQNHRRAGGDKDDYTVNLYVNSISHSKLSECVQPPVVKTAPTAVAVPDLVYTSTPMESNKGAATGGGMA